MPVAPLTVDKLRRLCDPNTFTFETTEGLPANSAIIGQPRGLRAIEFGIGIRSQGYNIFVMGAPGTGRTSTIERYLAERTRALPVPDDWVYVNNFTIPHQPRAIELPAGEGIAFQQRMTNLIDNLKRDLPKAFAAEAYRDTIDDIQKRLEGEQQAKLRALQAQAAEFGFTIVRTASGMMVAPLHEGRVMTREEFAQLAVAEQEAIGHKETDLGVALDELLFSFREMEKETKKEIEGLNQHVAEAAIEHHFVALAEQYADQDEIQLYLDEVHQDVLHSVDDFHLEEEQVPHEIDWRRYGVNLFIDQRATEGAPVIIEDNPTYHNLLGRIEYEMRMGALSTHFMNIRAGSLHRASGGYIIMTARDILSHPGAWEALKRALVSRRIVQQVQDGNQFMTKSLDPEPIPLDVKVVLVGSPYLYYILYDTDESFGDLFKVKADFSATMPRDAEHEMEYAMFVANRCEEEKLRPFDRTAVARVVEYGAWLAEHQDKLSTRFGAIADLVREAHYWSGQNGRKAVTADDVKMAQKERLKRANRLEERLREDITSGMHFIDTAGSVIGQVNGLTVLDLGDHSFGQPGRITARTYMGDSGVVNIEREVDLSGPIHNKGLLILSGYLGEQYARRQPLTLSASLTFEQNYSDIDGDSAASAELYALLSSLSDIPLKQGIAVTGSVNQRGEVQPIGGANEKIEGFYAVCREKGLTGEQGVIIPAANVVNLMLSDEVVEAVVDGRFHIWPVRTSDEGLSLLTGLPAGAADGDGSFPEGTVHHAVQKRLASLARDLKSFGHDDDDDEDQKDGDDGDEAPAAEPEADKA